MDAINVTTLKNSAFFIAMSAIIAIAIGFIVYTLISRRNTVPSGSASKKEGFQGPANGVSSIPCGQESSHVTDILEIFAGKMSTLEEGNADFTEFKQIMSKLCCIKHDLMSSSQVVRSTLYTPYNNAHDRENPAETVARCFTKSLNSRDLDIIFSTWKNRGLFLISRVCTSYNLNSMQTNKVSKHFTALWSDVYDIAKTTCPPSENSSKGESPRDPVGFVNHEVDALGPYKGYY